MKKIVLILLLSSIYLIGCHKNNSNHNIERGDYPIAVGNKWVYQVSDDRQGSLDTQTITILDKIQYANDSAVYHTQTVRRGVVLDSSIIITSDHGVWYQSQQAYNSLFINLRITFPVLANSRWEGQRLADSLYTVSVDQTDLILGHTYTNVIHIKRQQTTFEDDILGDIYIAPRIGIIYQYLNVPFDYIDRKSIRLISYELH
jgi:hypothetical protein